MTELKDWLNSVNHTKEYIMEDSNEKEYPPYIINRCLSGFLDTIMYANEMNKYSSLPNRLQYDFFINSLRKRKRFSPWLKKDKIQDLDAVKSYYGYSIEKAQQALRILNKEQLDYIKQKLDVGGKK
ncbi:clamp loader of DNA polymerase [Synechococcus phage DSL-LC02]|nr:clamp loader of DNA polymerase [Synechococcus phage DSL-LC02]